MKSPEMVYTRNGKIGYMMFLFEKGERIPAQNSNMLVLVLHEMNVWKTSFKTASSYVPPKYLGFNTFAGDETTKLICQAEEYAEKLSKEI